MANNNMADVLPNVQGQQSLQRAGEVAGEFTDTDKVYLYDSQEKTYRPIDSPEALLALLGLDPNDESSMGQAFSQVNVLSASDLGDPLWKGKIISQEGSIKEDGKIPSISTFIDGGSIGQQTLDHYGATPNKDLHAEIVNNIGAFFRTITNQKELKEDTFRKYINNPQNVEVISTYADALLYGGYTFSDVYRDLKAKELAVFDPRYEGIRGISEDIKAEEWKITAEGLKATGEPGLMPPQGLADMDPSVWNNSIFKISDAAFKTIIPVIDIDSPEFKAEAEKIQAQYYDVMMQKSEATTEQAKDLADSNWNIFKKDIEKRYGIALSDKANTAWSQLEGLFEKSSATGLTGSGLLNEATDKYLSDVRKGDQRARESRISEEENTFRRKLMETGSSSDIKKFIDASPENLQKAQDWGLIPDTETVASWDPETKKIMTDEYGNYRSGLYQDQFANMYNLGEQKRSYQEQKLFQQKADDEAKAYAFATGGTPLSSYQETIMPQETEKPKETVVPEPQETIKPQEQKYIPDPTNVDPASPTYMLDMKERHRLQTIADKKIRERFRASREQKTTPNYASSSDPAYGDYYKKKTKTGYDIYRKKDDYHMSEADFKPLWKAGFNDSWIRDIR